jgi:hypothetical protein
MFTASLPHFKLAIAESVQSMHCAMLSSAYGLSLDRFVLNKRGTNLRIGNEIVSRSASQPVAVRDTLQLHQRNADGGR